MPPSVGKALLLALHSLHFHPLISHRRLPGRRGAVTVSHLHRLVSLFRPFTCGSALNPISTPPVACPLSNFSILSSLYLPLARRAASSRVPDLFINNSGALPHRFLLLSVVFHFEADVRQSFHFRRAPSLRRRDSLTFLPFLSTHGNSSSRWPRDSSLASPSYECGNKETPRPSNFPVLTRDL